MVATIADVANAAGVSPAAVSRFLNGRLDLPPATRDRINAAVEALGYQANAVARRLRSSASETLGFVTTDIGYPFFAAIASAAEAEAERHGYTLAIFNSRNDPGRELRILNKITAGEVDGILFLTNHADEPRIASKISALRKVVMIDEDVRGATAPRLFAENLQAAEAGTEHLIGFGHRKIAFVGAEGLSSSTERLEGFTAALRKAGLVPAPGTIMLGPLTEAFGAQALEQILSLTPRPTAVLATAEMFALGLLRAARHRGLSVPRDLSLVTFEDSPIVDLIDPALTTLRQSPQLLGEEGVRLLLAQMADDAPPPGITRLPVDLVRRASVAPPP